MALGRFGVGGCLGVERSGARRSRDPRGTWAGRTRGLYDKDGVLHNVGNMVGSGAYESLIHAVSRTVPPRSSTADHIGVIQTGTPPPGLLVTPPGAP